MSLDSAAAFPLVSVEAVYSGWPVRGIREYCLPVHDDDFICVMDLRGKRKGEGRGGQADR